MRKLRIVFGTVSVKNPRWMLCQRCLPDTCMAFTVLNEICPDQATPELMELTARLGSMLPYRKAAELLTEFLPVEPTEAAEANADGWRLEKQSVRQRADIPPITCERKQLELSMPNDTLREFVVSVDTAHVRRTDPKAARNFEKPAVGADCGPAIISRPPTPRRVKCGHGRCKPFSQKDIQGAARSRFPTRRRS